MFNPHIHQQQQQQQQQFHQHLRQLQQLFQQQQPPPPPPPQPPPAHHVAHHHHQTQRAIAVSAQTAPPPRMVNLCQATQTTIIAPNPMLQGAILMQQMQGNMRGFGMGGQQFRQFFTPGTRSSLLGPVPMGMAIKTPLMGFPAARPFHPHARYYNNNTVTTTATTTAPSSSTATEAAARQPDMRPDSEQTAAESSDDQPAVTAATDPDVDSKTDDTATEDVGEPVEMIEEQHEEPAFKKRKTEGSETGAAADSEATLVPPDGDAHAEEGRPEDCVLIPGASTEELEDGTPEEILEKESVAEEESQDKDDSVSSPGLREEVEDVIAEGANKFYCYLCSITCHNQQNFRTHMNSISHQQRMMEIQHMSNACLVTLLPRVQESLQGAVKDGEKKETKRWCGTCHTHFSSSIMDHRRTKEHKLATRTAFSSCTVCKKPFRNPQSFLEHLQSLEHRQNLHKLQEEGDDEALAKLTAVDADGFMLEEEEELSEGEEEEERQGKEGDEENSEEQCDWSSRKEVTLKNMTSDEQHDPDTVYGSSFLVPVSGFICRLCKKFYHFDSSALHSHCTSLPHFENLKMYKAMFAQKEGEDVDSSSPSVQSTDLPHSSTDCLVETSLDDDVVTNQNSAEVDQQILQIDTQLCKKEPESDLTCTDRTDQDMSRCIKTEATPTTPVGSREEPDADSAATAEDANDDEENADAPSAPGKRIGCRKPKAAPKRRSGRVTNRR